ncbi:hypothetical protein BSU04_25925 [Caballeronia sordidicola]|uniref:Uncharacterized protein n=1 Tax=Caballeronia sordidicola TaxID=196367 RepID=A0A226WWV1_CABSO|nr:hypothetical protein BSU04_25925 [Caballeronia sordidicola]
MAVPFAVALAMCMKSLSSHDRRAVGMRRKKICSIDDMTQELVESGEVSRSAEDAFMAAETFREHALAVNKERAAMRDDPIAKMVFNGIIDGSSAPEMRLRHKLSHAEFKAARQRAMRRIERVFGPAPGSRPEPARSRPHPDPRSDVRSNQDYGHDDCDFHA